MTPAGLEPAIPGSVGRCLIHWATGPAALTVPESQKRSAPMDLGGTRVSAQATARAAQRQGAARRKCSAQILKRQHVPVLSTGLS